MRYWAYTAAGLSTPEIAKVVLFCSLGFWLGFLLIGGIAFIADPVTAQAFAWADSTTQPLGIAFLTILSLYTLLTALPSAGYRLFGMRTFRLRLPTLPLTVGQIAVGALDLWLMAGAFHALLPASVGVGFATCTAAMLIAMVAGNLSLVPGGLGVFESAMVLMLGKYVAAPELAAALLMFRGVYLLAPLFLAGLLLGGLQWPALRTHFATVSRPIAKLMPQLLAMMVFTAGTLLILSGSVPAAQSRLQILGGALALPFIEASHFLASLIGAALLLLARGLWRRLDSAWLLTLLLLFIATLFSLAKGWDYEEAAMLVAAIVILLPFRDQFHRQSSLLDEPPSVPWAAAIIMVLGTSAWLVQFTHRHELQAGLSWWDFALHGEASRSARAMVGTASLLALFGLSRLLRPVYPSIGAPSSDNLERARWLVERSPRTYANLVLRGDKALLFSTCQDAFLMYSRCGRSCIAMGDPVGSTTGVRELLGRFKDMCNRHGTWCVFFEVREDLRADYAELGLVLTPLGEQARVELRHFDLALEQYRGLRRTCARLIRQGYRFEIVPRESVEPLLPELAQISKAWLANKATHEKGFSNASFDAAYLKQFPLALVRDEKNIVAFANIWQGADRQELSIDLMRHLPSAPNGSMDLLFCELMTWGRVQGFRWFDFGMAPLSGLDSKKNTLLWARIGTLLYRHGEHFYNFQGLRRYKAKFKPEWIPLYLASPGGVALPAILVDVTTLIAGSLAGIVTRHGPRIRQNAREKTQV
ncbi:bifunctional lysylphosphatidylglycerol flippase/synthetase MprF [Aquabacterium sp. CECT 9606]|uniref:bifunctional lysylphosphatidylglycerol flippase/synthetase MprF n=1 Tax=Aquabacterium sp. CECT 9606 TaxID=2845822 RepID=UPI001E394CE8|nr:bifunctional lysylphosphatidylglycerol flippase/synthetase MprF [Aquabacterium sp. CECT 9606]CAH0355879.1 Phosphatidylglycerol lysyltransferase [Aquabacterium sp. CECT 9606]